MRSLQILSIGVARSSLPARLRLLSRVRVILCCSFLLALFYNLRIDLALAGECARDIAVRAERISCTRERCNGMLAAWICTVRLEKYDILALDLWQEREHLRIGRTEPQPVAERHGLVAREVFRHFLHREEVGVCFLCHRFGDKLRISRKRRINHAPFFHKKQSPPILYAILTILAYKTRGDCTLCYESLRLIRERKPSRRLPSGKSMQSLAYLPLLAAKQSRQ